MYFAKQALLNYNTTIKQTPYKNLIVVIVVLLIGISGIVLIINNKKQTKIINTPKKVEVATQNQNQNKSTTEDVTYNPLIDPKNFTRVANNKYFSLEPGKTLVYKEQADNEILTNKMVVTNQTKIILGVETIVVYDTVTDEDNELVEETYDWYAQDNNGTVWYFGEDTKEYENGIVSSTEGSWEAGINGAKPGIIMTSNPKVGDVWKQEYLKGEAEDLAQVLELNKSKTVPAGTYQDCIVTKDWSALAPNILENKYYCSGNVVYTTIVRGGSEVSELENITIE